MRAVDTNLIVRYLTVDDPGQAAKARAVIGTEPIFVPTTVLLETEWVLRKAYQFPTDRVISALRTFLGLPGVTSQDPAAVNKAIAWAESGMDFADALHLAASSGCESFLTFDRRLVRAARRVAGVSAAMP